MVGKIFETNEFHMNLRSGRKNMDLGSNEFDVKPPCRRKGSSIDILPEEMIFKILVLLPAHLLHDVVRFVCRAWHAIVQDPLFVTAHWSLSPRTVLLDTLEITPTGSFQCYNALDASEGDVKLTDFKFLTPEKTKIQSSCNGLVLIFSQRRFYVGNPVTRRILPLPELPTYMYPNDGNIVVLAFEASSKVYKAVLRIIDKRSRADGFAILTVGVDKAWRMLTPKEYPPTPRFFYFIREISVPGFIYYVERKDGYVYGLDLESETLKCIKLPNGFSPSEVDVTRKGDSISLWNHHPDFSVEVWLLKDYKTEEWVKYLYIEGEPLRNACEKFQSRNNMQSAHLQVRVESWLGYDKKILFDILHIGRFQPRSSMTSFHNLYILYDLNTHACTEIDMKSKVYPQFVPFISTLVWV